VRYQFVDCRWELGNVEAGRELYLAGHIPGASFLDVDRDLSAEPGERGRHPLPDERVFAEAASRAGIGPGVLVVAYDQGMTGGAARLWWLLRHFGHHDVAVLDGGISAWRGSLRAGEEQIEPRMFEPRPRADDLVTAAELAARLGDERLSIVDAREPGRYHGAIGIDPVGGRIPGAVNVPHFDPESPEEVLSADEIVVYCGSGVTACVDLLALAEAGRADAKLYPGSWSEWYRLDLPIERD
jgi:thiosulfate/3-mercaptopyruvate sulfurtransferase